MRHACRRMDAAASTRMSRPFVCRPCFPVISAGTDAADPITTGNYPASPCHGRATALRLRATPGNRPASPCHGRATALRLRATAGQPPCVSVPRLEICPGSLFQGRKPASSPQLRPRFGKGLRLPVFLRVRTLFKLAVAYPQNRVGGDHGQVQDV